MDKNFTKCLDLVLKYEGGFSNHKADPGGPTNLGITLATFRRYVEPSGTVDDLKRLTRQQAATCYQKQYWDVIRGDELPSGVDLATFDYAVNSGPSRAAKHLQSVIGAKQDGKIGPETLAKVRPMVRGTVINGLCDKRMAFLKSLKTWGTFGKGWTSRVSSVRSEALKMAVNIGPVSGPPPLGTPIPGTQPAPAPAKPVTSEVGIPATKPAGKTAAAAGIFAIIALSLATWWNEFTSWLSSLF